MTNKITKKARKENNKLFKEIAAKLPEAWEEVKVLKTCKGKDLSEEDRGRIKGFIKPDTVYQVISVELKKVDHYKNLRKYYKKYRDKFLEKYTIALRVHLETMKEKYPKDDIIKTVQSS